MRQMPRRRPSQADALDHAIERASPAVNLSALFARFLPEAGSLPVAERLRSVRAATLPHGRPAEGTA